LKIEGASMSFFVSLNIDFGGSLGDGSWSFLHCFFASRTFLYLFVDFEDWNIERGANGMIYRHQEDRGEGGRGEERCGD
jgi:hypothetical protein